MQFEIGSLISPEYRRTLSSKVQVSQLADDERTRAASTQVCGEPSMLLLAFSRWPVHFDEQICFAQKAMLSKQSFSSYPLQPVGDSDR